MVCAFLALLLLTTSFRQDTSAYAPAAELLQRMREANDRIADLRCTFTMEIKKEGRAIPLQRTVFRYRSHPEIIHLTFMSPYEGRIVCYRQGSSGGQMRVRPDGFWHFLTATLDPTGDRAMEDAIDPVTMQGFPNIVAAAQRLLDTARTTGRYSVTIDSGRRSSISGGTIRMQFRASASEEFIMEVDASTFLPFLVSRRCGSSSAVYRYENIETNPGMSDAEFDV